MPRCIVRTWAIPPVASSGLVSCSGPGRLREPRPSASVLRDPLIRSGISGTQCKADENYDRLPDLAAKLIR
jgi:hypothetical protein